MKPVIVSLRDTLVHSYLFLRRAVGLIGVALPVVLIVGGLITGAGLLDSVSGYYYSDLRDIYIGGMSAIGVFLLSYRGYGPIDDITADIAAVAAIGTALFPTTPDSPTRSEQVIGAVHIVFSAIFFLTLAFYCLFLFTRTDKPQPTPRKLQRNAVYRVSGVLILVSLALIVLFNWILDTHVGHPALWLETLATTAFGLAWLTKGQAILADLEPD